MKVATFFIAFLIATLLVMPALGAEDVNQTTNPYYWYNKAVDLAYEGKFSEALDANDQALAIESDMPLALANKAGILVQLKHYDEAILVADKVMALNQTELPNTIAAASYSKGDALAALGRTDEAKDAYDKAYSLDSTLVPPVLTPDVPVTATTKAPMSLMSVIAALGSAVGAVAITRKRSRS